MGVFPLAAAIVSAVFSAALLQQFRTRRRSYQALWAIAMAMYAVASSALFIGVAVGWSPWMYRVYWLFGAVLTVPFLAGGEAELLGKRPWVHRAVVSVLAILTAIALLAVMESAVSSSSIDAAFPRGSEAFHDGTQALLIARLYSYVGYAFLVGGTLWSAWSMRAAPQLRGRFWGTLLIAGGATVVAGGSAFAATGVLAGFSITLVVGIALMFLGFIKASSSSASSPPQEASTAGRSADGAADRAQASP